MFLHRFGGGLPRRFVSGLRSLSSGRLFPWAGLNCNGLRGNGLHSPRLLSLGVDIVALRLYLDANIVALRLYLGRIVRNRAVSTRLFRAGLVCSLSRTGVRFSGGSLSCFIPGGPRLGG
jgi:hypothetical protein